MTDNQYLSFYIYYAEPWETFLVKAIGPLMKKLFDDELISQYFFIRYWELGPHIRLRLKIKLGINERVLSEIVQKDLNNFILKNPSKMLLTPEMEEVKRKESWRENNQIVSIRYQPETSRYGGVDAMPLAELQFFASSQIVLNEFLETPDWSYDHALGAAIKLHLGFVFSIGMTAEKAVDFFEKNCQDWLPRATEEKDNLNQQEKILAQFDNAYTAQKAAVLPYIQGLWKELQQNPTGTGNPTWENWLNINKAAYTNLELLEKTNLLETNGSENKRRNILSDFVHMTNNRLGVMNRDEGFLAFMLAKSLKS